MAYTKKDWQNDEVITEEALDNMENGISTNDSAITSLKSKVTTLEGKVVDATTTKKGLVKQATKVAEAVGANPTKAEFDALITALVNAGIMKSS